MHIYKDPYAPPLSPKVPVDKPPWFPSWKQYKGRTEWWAALGYTDPDLKRGLTTGIFSFFEEKDPRYLDPKVPDGTSLVGPLGKDSHYHRSHLIKWDTPGDFFDYQEQLRRSSSQFKQIAEKWDISTKHPGIAVNPLLSHIHRFNNKTLGANISILPTGRNLFQWHLGPRFWDKPLNEGCFEKGLALAKYAVPISFITYAMYVRGRGIPGIKPANTTVPDLVREWSRRALILPVFYAFTFGFTSCASATFRDEDDIWNWIAASAVCGLAHAAIRNNLPRAFALAAIGSFFGTFFQLIRVSHNGFGMPNNRMSQGFAYFTGPLEWKRVPLEGMETHQAGVFHDTFYRLL